MIAGGLLTRPAAFFLLFTMGVAFFLQHGGAPFGEREMAFLYGAFSLTLLLTGAGRFSLDALLQNRVRRSGERFFR